MLMPFSSAFTVNNLGISLHSLPIIYLVTGLATIFVGTDGRQGSRRHRQAARVLHGHRDRHRHGADLHASRRVGR
jgi:hypothetical protein